MKRVMIGALIGFIAAGLLSLGTILLAQEKKSEQTPDGELIVLGGLKIKAGASVEEAEKALKEQLIPAMRNVKGLEMKILKKMKMPGSQQPDSGAYDYVMMAEIESVQVFMQLLMGGDPALEKFGDVMKTYAGHPHINPYMVIAETEMPSEDDDEDEDEEGDEDYDDEDDDDDDD